jgi:transposase
LLPTWLVAARLWDGSALGADLQRRLLREYERWQFVHRQILDLSRERRRRILCDDTAHVDKVRRLLGLAGIGINGAWLLVYEFFAWRKLQNRKQAGALVGLTGTPYQSGGSEHEQGISKAGSKRMRKMLVELAWCWLRWQPQSALSQWYARRFGTGKGPARKIGIVAVARKLFIALWRYLERGEIPAGAKLVDWQSKLTSKKAKKLAA